MFVFNFYALFLQYCTTFLFFSNFNFVPSVEKNIKQTFILCISFFLFFKKKTFNFSKFEQQQQQQKWENIKGIFFQEKKTIFITVSFKSYYYYISFYQGLKLNIAFRITIKNLKMSTMYLLPSTALLPSSSESWIF